MVILKIYHFEYIYNGGFPSLCCEDVSLQLVNKDDALAYGKTEYRQVGKLN